MGGVENEVKAVKTLVRRISPMLAGQPPQIVGGALADLLAIWLASHVVENDKPATLQMRAGLLKMHVSIVEELIPANETSGDGFDSPPPLVPVH